ncbi:MAG TPA: chromosome segregation protein SMC, partial [Myxococcaceae bacterium]|nr:chromosome segregation protein SMC [Myxococcaceae bacterium]
MHIIELAANGVRGFSPGSRLEMGTGYVVLTPSSVVPVPLAGLLGSLLFPDGRGAEVAYQAPGQRGTVTLFFQGNDQGTYRLLRELGGAGVLHRVELATDQSELITDDSGL